MRTRWTDEPRTGAKLGYVTFENPRLDNHTCPLIEMRGAADGPRLCVMAGIHINEASSIAAATALLGEFEPALMKGTISIIPVVSTHNIFKQTMVTPPTLGRDLHWSYPGEPDGDFNAALAYALLHEWAADADVLLDLHGGDLDERMTRYVVIQSLQDAEFDARAEAFASCFDTPLVVALHPSEVGNPGRCCTALAAHRRVGLVAEAGDYGTTDPESVAWHISGIRQVAALLGIVEAEPRRRTDQRYLDRYSWISAPSKGAIERWFSPGDWVEAGDQIGMVFDCHGRAKTPIIAPASGYVMMQKSPLFVTEGFWIGALATPRETSPGTPEEPAGERRRVPPAGTPASLHGDEG